MTGRYLIVITEAVKVGGLLGHEVWRAQGCGALPIFVADKKFGPAGDAESIEMIRNLVENKGVYFSHTYNLTKSGQWRGS